jgi:hypothetical protein
MDLSSCGKEHCEDALEHAGRFNNIYIVTHPQWNSVRRRKDWLMYIEGHNIAIIKCDFMAIILPTESLQPYLSSRISQNTQSTIVCTYVCGPYMASWDTILCSYNTAPTEALSPYSIVHGQSCTILCSMHVCVPGERGTHLWKSRLLQALGLPFSIVCQCVCGSYPHCPSMVLCTRETLHENSQEHCMYTTCISPTVSRSWLVHYEA